MRLGPPPSSERTDPAVIQWLNDLYGSFARGQGFPNRFQMGEGKTPAFPVPLPAQAFITALPGDPTTFPDTAPGDPTLISVANDPIGSLFLRTDGGAATTLYVKEALLAAGWVAK